MPHTPTPYIAEKRNWRNEPSPHDVYIRGDQHEDDEGLVSTSVAIVIGNASAGTIPEDTADFICRACNSHADLLAALKELWASSRCEPVGKDGKDCWLVSREALAKASRAIAKAEGQL